MKSPIANRQSAIAMALAELRAEREQLDQVIRILEQRYGGSSSDGRGAPPLLVREVIRRGKRRQQQPQADNEPQTTETARGRGRPPKGIITVIRELVNEINPPFNAADVLDAVVRRYPKLKTEAENAAIGYHLRQWALKGELETVVPGRAGRAATFKRSANWSLASAEARYAAFRKGVPIPSQQEEHDS